MHLWKQQGNVPNLLTDLKSCKDLHWGIRIHAKAVESKNDSNIYVATALVKMYANSGSMIHAICTFESIHKPDVVSWNVLLLGYAQNGDGHAALELFSRMKACECVPTSTTYVAALKACTFLAENGDRCDCLERGRRIHLELRPKFNHYVQSALIDMYAKSGSMVEARHVFDSLENSDVVSCNALLLGYAENGEGIVALELFWTMKARGCVPNASTYVSALKACTSLADNGRKQDCLVDGRVIHSDIGCRMNHQLQSVLIEMYAKGGSMFEARRIFDSISKPDVVLWNVLILGYAENGEGSTSLVLFSRMKERRYKPDSTTYVAALKACTSLAVTGDRKNKEECLELGRDIHLEIGCHLNQYVQSMLIDMYAKCSSMTEARRVFDNILKPNVVSWTALLLGYAENGEGLVTLELFSKMKSSGCVPNSVTYVAALKACGLTGALALGRIYHSELSEVDPHVATCLIDFYAKCGSMIECRKVFDSHSEKSVATWTALLAGYSRFGDSDSVFNLFEAMQDEGIHPNSVTFLCMLLCCSHAGLVEKAKTYFEAMHVKFGITPKVTHYNCIIDVLGRANHLSEAIAMVRKMPCNPDAVTWRELLGACCKWKNVVLGWLAFLSLVDMDKKDASAYVIMARIYLSRDMWEERKMVLEVWNELNSV